MIGPHNFVFDSRFCRLLIPSELWKSGERINRVSQLVLGRDVVEMCWRVAGTKFARLDKASLYRQTNIQLAINEQQCFPNLHQLTATLACSR